MSVGNSYLNANKNICSLACQKYRKRRNFMQLWFVCVINLCLPSELNWINCIIVITLKKILYLRLFIHHDIVEIYIHIHTYIYIYMHFVAYCIARCCWNKDSYLIQVVLLLQMPENILWTWRTCRVDAEMLAPTQRLTWQWRWPAMTSWRCLRVRWTQRRRSWPDAWRWRETSVWQWSWKRLWKVCKQSCSCCDEFMSNEALYLWWM